MNEQTKTRNIHILSIYSYSHLRQHVKMKYIFKTFIKKGNKYNQLE